MSERARQKRRLLRQFQVLERRVPALRRPLGMLLRQGRMVVRLPLALLLMAGGLLSFLPFLGVWMLPLGILLLAVDVPVLRPPACSLTIRTRRWVSERLRRLRAFRDPIRGGNPAARPDYRRGLLNRYGPFGLGGYQAILVRSDRP